jgi:hypothetical protein
MTIYNWADGSAPWPAVIRDAEGRRHRHVEMVDTESGLIEITVLPADAVQIAPFVYASQENAKTEMMVIPAPVTVAFPTIEEFDREPED